MSTPTGQDAQPLVQRIEAVIRERVLVWPKNRGHGDVLFISTLARDIAAALSAPSAPGALDVSSHTLTVRATADDEANVVCQHPGCWWSATWQEWEVEGRLPREQRSHQTDVRAVVTAALSGRRFDEPEE